MDGCFQASCDFVGLFSSLPASLSSLGLRPLSPAGGSRGTPLTVTTPLSMGQMYSWDSSGFLFLRWLNWVKPNFFGCRRKKALKGGSHDRSIAEGSRLSAVTALRCYLHFGGGGERNVTGGRAVLPLLLHGLQPHQCREGSGQVAAQQSLLRRDVEQQGQRL